MGGGGGVYLTSFRASGLLPHALVTVEPSSLLEGCVLAGVTHEVRSVLNYSKARPSSTTSQPTAAAHRSMHWVPSEIEMGAGVHRSSIDTEQSASADLVLCIEVAEHIPLAFHGQLVDALTARTTRWLLFTAAPPGMPGYFPIEMKKIERRHVACRTPAQWRALFEARSHLVFDRARTDLVRAAARAHVRITLLVFRTPMEEGA
jgi:hypothetical protein